MSVKRTSASSDSQQEVARVLDPFSVKESAVFVAEQLDRLRRQPLSGLDLLMRRLKDPQPAIEALLVPSLRAVMSSQPKTAWTDSKLFEATVGLATSLAESDLRPPAEQVQPASFAFTMSLADPSVVLFRPWNAAADLAVRLVEPELRKSRTHTRVGWLAAALTLGSDAVRAFEEIVAVGGFDLLASEAISKPESMPLVLTDGKSIARLRVFPSRGSAEEWIERVQAEPLNFEEQFVGRQVRSDFTGIRSELQKLIGSTPQSYDAQRNALLGVGKLMQAEAAGVLQPLLNEHVKTLPQHTYEEKKSVAKWLNAELRQLGLALRCPKTTKPAFLVAHPGGQPGFGRFHLEVSGPDGKPHRTVTSAALPVLELMPDPVVPGSSLDLSTPER